MPEPTSTKPYLLRAIYEWCVDSGYTPYISVVVGPQTRVPVEYVRDGEIVLNIGPLATSRLSMGNEIIECTARFSGVARDLAIPVTSVAAIYARENGHGMSFEVEKAPATPEAGAETGGGEKIGLQSVEPRPAAPAESPEPPRPTGGKPTLRRIK